MKIYLVVSITPEGGKALCGHYEHFEEDSWRSEVHYNYVEAVAQRDSMEQSFAHTGMRYEVREVQI